MTFNIEQHHAMTIQTFFNKKGNLTLLHEIVPQK